MAGLGEAIKKALIKFGLEMKPIKKSSQKEEISELYNKVRIPQHILEPKDIVSREYKIFKQEEAFSHRLRGIYEKLCHYSESLLKVNPDKQTREKIEKAIEIAHLNITPGGVAALTMLSCFFVCLITIILMLTQALFGFGLSVGQGMIGFFFSVPIAYYLYTYPMKLEKRYLVRVGSELSFLLLYMVIYMRESPNLEGALAFASKNLTGPLALDMRKLLWDVEIGKYKSVDEALINYVTLWVGERYFVEAIQILRSSTQQVTERRMILLEESIDLVLSGSREKAKYYSQSLKMPILMIHALGILLPVMGLVMFPIIGIFLDVNTAMLFIGYDVVLPMILFFFINDILESRPITFSRLSLGHHPDIPPPKKFAIKTKNGTYFVPVMPFAILISLPFLIIGLSLYLSAGKENLNQSVVITTGIVAGLFTYYFLSSFQKVAIRDKTRKIEAEFTEALFQLGNHVSSGAPLEVAVDRSTKAISGLEIKSFFEIVLRNIKSLGMTFSEAVFDKEYGAITFYPSKLVRSIMRIVVDASRKGVQVASMTMLNISRYLKNIHENQERIFDMLEDVLSSLKFQGFLLTPLVSGIIVTMATVIINIMSKLTDVLSTFKSQSYATTVFFPWKELSITPGEFQLVCSLYFIETSMLVGIFINGIENGEDEIGKEDLITYLLLIGYVIYLACLFGSLYVFGPIMDVQRLF
jgi:hypothetical protein